MLYDHLFQHHQYLFDNYNPIYSFHQQFPYQYHLYHFVFGKEIYYEYLVLIYRSTLYLISMH
ncbi:hypothetical protein C2G38_2052963 [Gigaspora rosea]|uniref:Uncharacterized protein n=1 Tax=Gigaspora rosea TaxID=44941 RepID=A0A397W7S1_9GLOM|nr:hypothetical protein C2G38_2052963 [Gigaspora rosea]